MNILNHKPFSNSSLKILTNISDDIFELKLDVHGIMLSANTQIYVFCLDSMVQHLNELVRCYDTINTSNNELYVTYCRTSCYAEMLGCSYIDALIRRGTPNWHVYASIENPINQIIGALDNDIYT